MPINNFHQVSPLLYRGGQPNEKGFVALSEMAVKTVVSLRWRKRRVESERLIVERLGMRFVSIPLNYWTLPSQAHVKELLDIIDDQTNHPVFIHCFHGADRTGVMVAMYRILRHDWSLKEAYKEMRACGFHRFATAHFKLALWRLARHATRQQSK
ncbi:MAG: dual specificity protein phosphatase family protein [Candidatus Obscuribacterales bacterium]